MVALANRRRLVCGIKFDIQTWLFAGVTCAVISDRNPVRLLEMCPIARCDMIRSSSGARQDQIRYETPKATQARGGIVWVGCEVSGVLIGCIEDRPTFDVPWQTPDWAAAKTPSILLRHPPSVFWRLLCGGHTSSTVE